MADDVEKEVSDLDNQRIERDAILAQKSEATNDLETLRATIARETISLEKIREDKKAADEAVNERLTKKEESLNQREADHTLAEVALEKRDAAVMAREDAAKTAETAFAIKARDHSNAVEMLVADREVLDARESFRIEREAAIARREAALDVREEGVNEREAGLSVRERTVETKENAFVKRGSDLTVSEKNFELRLEHYNESKAVLENDRRELETAINANTARTSELGLMAITITNERAIIEKTTQAIAERESAAESKNLELRAREKKVSQRERDAALKEQIHG